MAKPEEAMLMLGWTAHKFKKGDFCIIHVARQIFPRNDVSKFPFSLEGTWRGLVVLTGPSHELGRKRVHYQVAAVFDDSSLELSEDGPLWQGKEPDRFYTVWPSTLRNETTLEAVRFLERLDRSVLALVARARKRVNDLRARTDDVLSSLVLF